MSEFFEYKFYNRDKANCDKCLTGKPFEFNENDAKDRCRALNELKQLIGESIDFALKDKSCADDDEFLLRFLFARKFNVSDAFKLLINYHDFKQRNAEILSKISALDENIQMALRDGFPTIIPQRDRKGRKILVLFASNWSPANYSLDAVFRALLLSLEKLLEDIQNQANGFVIIVDWTNFTYKQTSSMQLKVLKLMIEGLQVSILLSFIRSSVHDVPIVFYYLGLFPGHNERSAFFGAAVVCRSDPGIHSSISTRRDSRTSHFAWRQFVNAARFCGQRCAANRIGRRNEIDQSIGLGAFVDGVQSKSKKPSKLPFNTIDNLLATTERLFSSLFIEIALITTSRRDISDSDAVTHLT